MRLAPTTLRLARRTTRTRLPFRFGIATLTEAPMLFASVEARAEDGATVTGHAAELLVPKWFAKDPETSLEDDRSDLEESVRRAFEFVRAHAAERDGATVFDLWLAAQRALVDAPAPGGPAPLVRMFGLALVERCLLDAVCHASALGFDAALRSDAFGLARIADADPELAGWSPRSLGRALERTAVRHTVGLVDALDAGDLADPAAPRPDDHPETLVEDIERYGLSLFKLKVAGDAARDLERLERIAALAPERARFTIDGNEQYADPGDLADLLDELERRGTAPGLFAGLISIEQPVSRAATFDPATARGVARLAERAPVIIDEADATLDAYPRARSLGYGGVSMKACKGVLRAVVNRARIDVVGEGLQSAEDLTNLPTLPLLQDLAVVASLGLDHVERNGHHYFRGAEHLSGAELRHLAEHHGDLFHPDGRLRIEGGSLSLTSTVAAPGFGYAGPVEGPQNP